MKSTYLNAKENSKFAIFLLVLTTIIELLTHFFYEKMAIWYVVVIPFIFYVFFLCIQTLMYQRLSSHENRETPVRIMLYGAVFIAWGLFRLSQIASLANMNIDAIGMFICFACFFALINIKRNLLKSNKKLDDQAFQTMTRRFSRVGLIFAIPYLGFTFWRVFLAQ